MGTLGPSVRALFATDMTAQRRNLMQTLRTIVRRIDRLDLPGRRSSRLVGATPATAFARPTTRRSGSR